MGKVGEKGREKLCLSIAETFRSRQKQAYHQVDIARRKKH